ncbi:hypothetical protein FXN63_24900 [Pigmentiphaga aceris]|uniref:Uncharacterized protein n=1 Tax=Pigmentiphaga aceris TaxID=1940612 RepID=A0A5C0B5K9_9BURK|nr:hypothetical protein FXN63_24900 [Pigmentiphaga aceris]
MTPLHGLVQWESIRTYMEKGPEFAPGVAPYEGLHTFDKEREDMREEYLYKERSALGVAWWYVSHVFTLWRFPYWVAEWDHGYSMKAMPDSIAAWSQAIPPEEWAKPSAELKEESVKIEAAFAEGINFAKYFESKLVKID